MGEIRLIQCDGCGIRGDASSDEIAGWQQFMIMRSGPDDIINALHGKHAHSPECAIIVQQQALDDFKAWQEHQAQVVQDMEAAAAAQAAADEAAQKAEGDMAAAREAAEEALDAQEAATAASAQEPDETAVEAATEPAT